MSINFEDRVAIVTGAGGGLGRCHALDLARRGAKVVVNDLGGNVDGSSDGSLSAAETVVEEIKAAGGQAMANGASVTDRDQVAEMVQEVMDKYGRIDVLINNAGATWGAPIEEFPEAGWDKVMDTNVKGVFFLTQKLLPMLEKAASHEDPARVINVGSVDGIKTPIFDNFSYGPSKAAVHHLTRVLAAHLVKRNIICNAIAPGPFPTWMLSAGVGFGGETDVDWSSVGESNPRGRVGTPEDIAGLAIFLSSRAGAFTVGEVITCDGGSVACA